MFVSGYVYRLLRAEARRLGVRWSALMVLVDLNLLGVMQQRALVEVEQMRGSTMTVLLQQMEGSGWIARTLDPADGRIVRVAITSAGRAELKRVGALLRRRLVQEIADLPPGTLRTVASSLEPLSAALVERAGRHQDHP